MIQSLAEDRARSFRPPEDAPRDLLDYAREHGFLNPEGAEDRELWVESMIRCQMADRMGAQPISPDDIDLTKPLWGPIRNDALYQQSRVIRAADSYAFSPTFRRYAGRDIVVIDGSGSDFAEAAETIYRLHPDVDAVWLKSAQVAKQYLERVRRGHSVIDPFMWVHLEELKDVLFVSPDIHMEDEYRLWVLGGTVIAGAAHVADFTPLGNTAVFDPHFSDRQDVARVQSYRDVTEQIASQFADEGLWTYTLDLAWDGERPVIVELNPISNSGLFSLDWRTVADAMAAHPESLIPELNAGFMETWVPK